MPNMPQMTGKLSAFINQAQPQTMIAVEIIAPGHQLVWASFGCTSFPAASCNRNLPMRVPVSIVVRINRASNMIAKWYQYFQRLSRVPLLDDMKRAAA